MTVIDVNSNSSTCTSTVTVYDTARPTVICKNISVLLDTTGHVSLDSLAVNNGSTDNCGLASFSVSPNSFSCINSGANTVTLTVTDVNGNSSSATSVVTVSNTTAPVARCKNISVHLNSLGYVTIIGTDVDNLSTDDCGIASFVVSPDSFICSNIGANNVTLTVTDASGNSSQCVSTVTVSDTIAPIATCKNITVQLDSAGTVTIDSLAVNNG